MIDLSKLHTTITVHSTCRVPLKGNPMLGPGVHHVEGDVSARFNRIAARSDIGNGLYEVEVCNGCVGVDPVVEAELDAIAKKAELAKALADKEAAELAELQAQEDADKLAALEKAKLDEPVKTDDVPANDAE